MKKLLILFALCALASSSFAAVTISDWTVQKHGDFGSLADGSISDASPAGFDFDAGVTDTGDNYYSVWFVSENVSGWVYDENSTFSVVVTGFDDVSVYGNKPNRLDVTLSCGDSDLYYGKNYSGAGTYVFGPDDVYHMYNTVNAGDSCDYVDVTLSNRSNTCAATGTTTGSIRFVVGEEEKPDTVVPDCT